MFKHLNSCVVAFILYVVFGFCHASDYKSIQEYSMVIKDNSHAVDFNEAEFELLSCIIQNIEEKGSIEGFQVACSVLDLYIEKKRMLHNQFSFQSDFLVEVEDRLLNNDYLSIADEFCQDYNCSKDNFTRRFDSLNEKLFSHTGFSINFSYAESKSISDIDSLNRFEFISPKISVPELRNRLSIDSVIQELKDNIYTHQKGVVDAGQVEFWNNFTISNIEILRELHRLQNLVRKIYVQPEFTFGITRVSLKDISLSKDDLNFISELSTLKSLEIVGGKIPNIFPLSCDAIDASCMDVNKSLSFLSNCKSKNVLESVHVSGVNIRKVDLSFIRECTHLKHLNLSNMRTLSSEVWSTLFKNIPSSLQVLILDSNELGREHLSSLKNLPCLEVLSLANISGIGAEDWSEIIDGISYEIVDLNLEYNSITESGLKLFHRFYKLKNININGCVNVALRESVDIIRQLPESIEVLEGDTLYLLESDSVQLLRFKNLKLLSIGNCGRIENMDLVKFKNSIKELYISSLPYAKDGNLAESTEEINSIKEDSAVENSVVENSSALDNCLVSDKRPEIVHEEINPRADKSMREVLGKIIDALHKEDHNYLRFMSSDYWDEVMVNSYLLKELFKLQQVIRGKYNNQNFYFGLKMIYLDEPVSADLIANLPSTVEDLTLLDDVDIRWLPRDFSIHCPKLRVFQLGGEIVKVGFPISMDDLVHRLPPTIEKLGVIGTCVNFEDPELLGKFKYLKSFNVICLGDGNNAPLKINAILDSISPTIIDLAICNMNISRLDGRKLQRLTKLKSIVLANCAMESSAWKCLMCHLPLEISGIGFKNTNYELEGIKYLSKLNYLTTFRIAGTTCKDPKQWGALFKYLPHTVKQLDFVDTDFPVELLHEYRQANKNDDLEVLVSPSVSCVTLESMVEDKLETPEKKKSKKKKKKGKKKR